MVILTLAITLSLVLGRLSGGSVDGLASLHLRGEALLVILLACQLTLPLLRLEGLYAQLAYAVWFGTFPVMVLVCLLNHRVPGMALAAAGLAANAVVVGLNRGMPVSPQAVQALATGAPFAVPPGDFVHVLLDGATRLPQLADILPVPGPVGLRSVVSIGDALLVCGVSAVVSSAMLRPRRDDGLRW